MEITLNRLELDVDAEVLFEEIRDDIQGMVRDAVSSKISSIVDDAVSEALDDCLSDEVGTAVATAVAEELHYNFDIEEHIDYDIVADEVKRRHDDGSAEHHAVSDFMKLLSDPEVITALRAIDLVTPKVLCEIIDTVPVRDLLMRLIADQLVFGQPVEIASSEGMR